MECIYIWGPRRINKCEMRDNLVWANVGSGFGPVWTRRRLGRVLTHVIAFVLATFIERNISETCMDLPMKFPYWLETSLFKTKPHVRILIYQYAFALTHALLNQH